MECEIARLAGNGDAAVELHVTLEGGVDLVVLAALLADEGSAFRVDRLDVTREGAKHVERLAAVIAVVLFSRL